MVLCPLADPSVAAALGHRGFRLAEFEQVMVRALGVSSALGTNPAVTVRQAMPEEFSLYVDVVGPNFVEGGELSPELRDLMRAAFTMEGATLFLATLDGHEAGGGALLIHDGVAMLAGAGTLPPHRHRGVQTALLEARLEHARRAGCDLAVMGATPGSGSQKNAERKGFQVAYTKAIVTKEPGG